MQDNITKKSLLSLGEKDKAKQARTNNLNNVSNVIGL